ncbi:uncharacterized protein LOC130669147 [Microplitis mediator]|uniref:uncharacterized protein LOC130669147 n=1 Tax=Microplitis mediator TaxID=375433 RepID=UPI0025555A5A|nr:uncharacterized protein LOC130669147 [Microplitis mediator]
MSRRAYKKSATIKFIDYVRKNQCLYNPSVRKQYGADYIENIWKIIAKDCALGTAIKARRKWMYLRAGYKSGLVDPKKKSNYHSELNFLYSFVQDINDDDDEEVQFILKREPQDHGYDRENSSEGSSVSTSISKNKSQRSRKLNQNRPATACTSGRQSVFSEYSFPVPVYTANGPPHIDNEDELKPFFESMYRTAKKLPPALQRHVKAQFFEIISTAEASAVSELTER